MVRSVEVDIWVLSENQEEVEFRGLRIARVVIVSLCNRCILGSSQLGLKCLRLDRIETIRKGDAIGAGGEFRLQILKNNSSCALESGSAGLEQDIVSSLLVTTAENLIS